MNHQAFVLRITGWWLNQPIWKICSSNWIISLIFGVKIKNIWNHHLDYSATLERKWFSTSTTWSPNRFMWSILIPGCRISECDPCRVWYLNPRWMMSPFQQPLVQFKSTKPNWNSKTKLEFRQIFWSTKRKTWNHGFQHREKYTN